MRRAVLKPSGEQAGVVDAIKHHQPPARLNRDNLLRVRQKHPNHMLPLLDVWPQIVEGVGVTTRDDGKSVRREQRHESNSWARASTRNVPASGTRSQSGRYAS